MPVLWWIYFNQLMKLMCALYFKYRIATSPDKLRENIRMAVMIIVDGMSDNAS